MEPRYHPTKTEQKWQKLWEEYHTYRTDLADTKKPKYYALVMFPYPSGDKLHIGHWYNFGPADSYARFMRMKGFHVFSPMGFDAFGLPAENYAIKTGIHPTVSIKKNVEFMIQQLKRMGCMYDWEKMVNTSTPDYYQWTQWIFLQMYKHGLAFRKKAAVNWCPSCQTVLANEQVQEGTCDRCDSVIVQKDLTQWMWKMSSYAERLLDGHKKINWPKKTISMQQNWIGRSEGITYKQHIKDLGFEFEAYDSVPQTFMAQTFAVIAPEHPLVKELVKGTKYEKSVMEFVENMKQKKLANKYKTEADLEGIFTGRYVENPFGTGDLPIWVASFVVMDYGSGIVNSSAHDERDFTFAKKYSIPLKPVMFPQDSEEAKKVKNLEYCYYHDEEGILREPDEFKGRKWGEVREDMLDYLEKKNFGKRTVNFKLRDWLISRQRYWGCPIPIVYCQKCGEVPVPEKDLPVPLPKEVDFKPRGDGKSPLASAPDFVKTKCPKCSGPAERETDTMDTFVDSSFYFLRYLDSNNEKELAGKKTIKHWMPVDMYIGGPEHACMHLIYARFVMMALKDFGFFGEPKLGSRGSQAEAVSGRGPSGREVSGGTGGAPEMTEPFARLVHQGLITHKGAKMSKSKGNVVSPDEFVEKYGSDVFRMYLMFMGPFTDGGDWHDRGITGIARFVDRLWKVFLASEVNKSDSEEVLQVLHRTIQKITQDIERFHFNTCLAALMEFTNLVLAKGLSLSSKKVLARLIAPFAPHFAEEVWEKCGGKESVFDASWPVADAKLLLKKSVMIVCQINGKFRGSFEMDVSASEADILEALKRQEKIQKYLVGKKILREVYVPGKLVNFVLQEG